MPKDEQLPGAGTFHLAAGGNLRGILAMVTAMGLFACGDTLMKIAATHLPTGELIFFRALFVTGLVLAALVMLGQLAQVRRACIAPVGCRAAGDVGSAFLFQSALAYMPLADLMSVTQIGPLLMTAASAVYLKEAVGWRRWTAAAVGLVGVLLIIRPGASTSSWWALAALASVFSSVFKDLATRRVDPSIPTLAVLVYSSVASIAFGLLLALFDPWSMPDARMLAILLGAAIFSMTGQFCSIVAMRSGELSVVAPFRYALIVFAIVLGYLVWGHLPDLIGFTGIAIVVGAGMYTFHREQLRRRERSTTSGG